MTVPIPLGRLARPQEIADAVEFLAGERASFVKTNPARITGGRTARGSNCARLIRYVGRSTQPSAVAVHDTGGNSMLSSPSDRIALGFACGVTRFRSVSVFFAYASLSASVTALQDPRGAKAAHIERDLSGLTKLPPG
ncbi:hypothetical protein ACIBW9_33730 [Streptomyces sp. NPDC049541]|uniref:hypothetical protein n=1 Tax=Streptomyces sp. NPDC049541 TaxID=3365594 RepID=UPI0037B02AC9